MQPVTNQETGTLKKEHYAYVKNGSCALLAAIEPLTGQRFAQVFKRRTKKEFTLFCQTIAQAYPNAQKIRLVMDNLPIQLLPFMTIYRLTKLGR